MGKVVHMFQGFETKEEAKRFVKRHGGYLLKPERNESDRIEFTAIKGEGLNFKKYPHVVVWNEVEE